MERLGASDRLRPVRGGLQQQARPAGALRLRRASPAPLLGLLAFAVAAPVLLTATSFVPVGGSAWLASRSTRGDAVVRRASKYYSNADRDRLAKLRKETRMELKQRTGPTTPTIDLDKLPSIDDIYNRKYTGNSTIDPIGGRKRYSYYILFKQAPGLTPEKLKTQISEYIWFLKFKMSCKDIQARVLKSPIDQSATVTLEYPMHEYGEMPRGQSQKREYSKAKLVKFDFYAPVSSHDYIQRKIYSDNNILRYMVLGHTRTFKHLGEDNELHL